MTVLIVAEHDNQQLRENFRSVVTAAKQITNQVIALVMGDNCQSVATAVANVAGVDSVRLIQHSALANNLAENCAAVIATEAADMSHVLMPSGAICREWLPRAAALCDVQMITDIIAVESADVFVRPLYAGNAIATIASDDATKFISVRTTAFEPITGDNASPAPITESTTASDSGLSVFRGERVSELARPELTTASIVVSGGRGVGSSENFQLVEKVADKLGAAVGASRAAVDAGYVPNDYQVGQTGKIVAPDLYIAIGISGAIQHIAGMKDSKYIVAINKDPDAPIFDIADYGLVADLFEALPQLEAMLD